MEGNKRLTEAELMEIRERAEYVANSDWYSSSISDLAEEDVPKLIAEIERLKAQLSEIIGAIYEYEPEGTALWDLAEAIGNDED
jgi:hypothetical protein